MINSDLFPFVSLVTFFLAFQVCHTVDPYDVGEYQPNATTILNLQAIQLDYNLRVFAPNETGSFRVVYFLGGFDGMQK